MTISQPVPVVIFCGGKGSRLKEETEFRPKPMVTVGGKPILWHIMKGYAHHGHTRFILCLGYKGNMIKEYFMNHRLLSSDFHLETSTGFISTPQESHHDNFQITFADTGEDTLTGERLLKVIKYLSADRFMVTYGDGVTDLDVNALLNYHEQKVKESGTIGTITGVHPRSKYGLVETNEQGIIREFKQYPVMKEYTNGGFMVFEKSGILSYLREGEMIEDVLIRMANDGKLSLYNHDGYWQCMDTYQDMESLNKQWNTEPKWKMWS